MGNSAMVVTYDDGWFQKLYDHKHSLAYQLYSPTYHKAIENGCIYVCLTGLDVDMMVRTIGRVNYTSMQKMAALLYQIAQASEKVIVTSPAGTNIKMLVDKKGDPFWEAPPSKGGFPQMLGGQFGYMIHRESVEGVLVFDGAIWPPTELGLLQSPVRLTIESGYVKQIDGGLEATVFSRWLDSFNHAEAYLIDHACFGFNPGVTRPSGRILEDERVFGCMQYGIGATELGSPAHTDGVVLNPSIWLDDLQIEEEGRYLAPELIALCRDMGAPGY